MPADLIFLSSGEPKGFAYIKTDQLDGETDWKLRKPIPQTQATRWQDLKSLNSSIIAERPKVDLD